MQHIALLPVNSVKNQFVVTYASDASVIIFRPDGKFSLTNVLFVVPLCVATC